MEWICPKKQLPGINQRVVLLKGTVQVSIKNKYEFKEHELHPADEDCRAYRDSIRLYIPFICLATVRPWNGTVDKFRSTDMLLKWPTIACCDQYYNKSHLDFLRNHGMHRENIIDFIDKRDLKINWQDVEQWIPIDEEE